ncbi:MAG: hypothetical protein GEU92_21525 [Alphaproteobacteria bacterium]|nr:hypothetical protein [Alphaproteobacteria bacterium]
MLNLIAQLRMPEELQDRYGYPEITDRAKRKILGLNQARLFGVDVRSKLRELVPGVTDKVLDRVVGVAA